MTSAASYQSAQRDHRILLIIVAGSLLTLALGLLQAFSFEWSVMALALVLLTILAVCKMEAALVLYALVAFMPLGPFFAVTGRFGYAEGLYPSELMLGLLVLIWGGKLVLETMHKKRLPVAQAPINTPLLCLIGAAVFSFVAAQFTWDYRVPIAHRYQITQVTEIGLLCMPVAVYLLISNSLRDKRYAKAMVGAVMAVGLIGFWSDCPWVYVPSFLEFRWTGLLVVPLLSFLYAQILVHKELGPKQLMAGCFLALLLLVQFAHMSWVVMWLSAAVSLCVISWFRSKKLFTAVISVALLTCLMRPYLFRDLLEAEREGYSLERLNIWASALRIGFGRPFWGIGPDNFYPYYSHYYANVHQALNVSSPHSNWVQIFVQYGIIGFAAFVWFIVACYRSLARFYRSTQDPFEKAFFLTTIGTFTAMVAISGLGDYIFPARANGGLGTFGITVYNWILIGVAFALGKPQTPEQREIT